MASSEGVLKTKERGNVAHRVGNFKVAAQMYAHMHLVFVFTLKGAEVLSSIEQSSGYH